MKRLRSRIATALIQKIHHQASFRCGYCLSSEVLLGMPMELEHLIPLVAGGTNEEDNLWLSCRRCNGFKGTQTTVQDELSGQVVALFNPRLQVWSEHFGWNEDGTEIVGLTDCGRTTVAALKLNNSEIVVTRRLWVSVGWWPPNE